DWRKFPDPDVYAIDRRPQGHLGFGSGKHFCLGSQMARLVTAVAMRRFLERVPDYHLKVDEVAWNSSSNFRSPAALQFAIGRTIERARQRGGDANSAARNCR